MDTRLEKKDLNKKDIQLGKNDSANAAGKEVNVNFKSQNENPINTEKKEKKTGVSFVIQSSVVNADAINAADNIENNDKLQVEKKDADIKEEEGYFKDKLIEEVEKAEPGEVARLRGVYNDESRAFYEQYLSDKGFKVPEDRDDIIRIRTDLFKDVNVDGGVWDTSKIDEKSSYAYDWLMSYYKINDRSLDRYVEEKKKANLEVSGEYKVSVEGPKDIYEDQKTNNCYCCTGTAMLNQFIRKVNNAEDPERKYSQHDMRRYKMEYRRPDETNYDVYINNVKEVEMYAGQGKTVFGSIFEMGDFFIDKLSNEQNINDVLLHNMVFYNPKQDKAKLKNMTAIFVDKVNEVLSSGNLVGVLRGKHYVTVSGLNGNKITYLDSKGNEERTGTIDEFMATFRSSDSTMELNWLSKGKTPEELKKEYSNLDYDEEKGYSLKKVTKGSRGDVYHTKGLMVTKEDNDFGFDDNRMEGIAENIYIPNPLAKVDTLEADGALQLAEHLVKKLSKTEKKTENATIKTNSKGQVTVSLSGSRKTGKKKTESKPVEIKTDSETAKISTDETIPEETEVTAVKEKKGKKLTTLDDFTTELITKKELKQKLADDLKLFKNKQARMLTEFKASQETEMERLFVKETSGKELTKKQIKAIRSRISKKLKTELSSFVSQQKQEYKDQVKKNKTRISEHEDNSKKQKKYETDNKNYKLFGVGFGLKETVVYGGDSDMMVDLKEKLRIYLARRKAYFEDRKLTERSAEAILKGTGRYKQDYEHEKSASNIEYIHKDTDYKVGFGETQPYREDELNFIQQEELGKLYDDLIKSVDSYIDKRSGIFKWGRGKARLNQVRRIREQLRKDNFRFELSKEYREMLNDSLDAKQYRRGGLLGVFTPSLLAAHRQEHRIELGNIAYREKRRKQREEGDLPNVFMRGLEWTAVAASHLIRHIMAGYHGIGAFVDRTLGFGTMMAANTVNVAGKVIKAPIKLLSMMFNGASRLVGSKKRWKVKYNLMKGWKGLEDGRKIYRKYFRGACAIPAAVIETLVKGVPAVFRGDFKSYKVYSKTSKWAAPVIKDVNDVLYGLGIRTKNSWKEVSKRADADFRMANSYLDRDSDEGIIDDDANEANEANDERLLPDDA